MPYRRIWHNLRCMKIRLLLNVIGRQVQGASKIDGRMMRQVSEIPEGTLFTFVVEPNVVQLSLYKHANRIERLSLDDYERLMKSDAPPSNVTVCRMRSFNEFTVLSHGHESIPQCIANQRVFLEGPANITLRFIQLISVSLLYLYPRIVAMRTVKRYQIPVKSCGRRLYMYAALPFQKRGSIHGVD